MVTFAAAKVRAGGHLRKLLSQGYTRMAFAGVHRLNIIVGDARPLVTNKKPRCSGSPKILVLFTKGENLNSERKP